jgi:hypothetical protein
MFSDQELSVIKIKKSNIALDKQTPPNSIFYYDMGEVLNQRTVVRRYLTTKEKDNSFLVVEFIYNMPDAPKEIIKVVHGKFHSIDGAYELISHMVSAIEINGGALLRTKQYEFKEFSLSLVSGAKPSLAHINNISKIERNAFSLQPVKSGLRVFIKCTEYGDISMTESADINSKSKSSNLITPIVQDWVEGLMSMKDAKGVLVEAFIDGDDLVIVDACLLGQHDLIELPWENRQQFLSTCSNMFNDQVRFAGTILENNENIINLGQFVVCKKFDSLFPALTKANDTIILSPFEIKDLILVDVSKMGLFAEGVNDESIEITLNYPRYKKSSSNKHYSYSKSESGFIAI